MVLLVFWRILEFTYIFFSFQFASRAKKMQNDVLEGEHCFMRMGVCIWGLRDFKFSSYSLHVDLLSANNRA